ncbi:hypothetical protein A3J32_02300 [Candidatus Saccharibacteria bacterium RIFCSPLOWO2_02_FULL_46_7]|nr:MAG: hypothetical protein A3J32_02300 [Candidatus Saccharibacteria bacterium RIFCSPLOWO2_02_FULL_46_7]
MKTIAIDIDDVLAANAEGFVEFSNRRWGTHLKPDDYTEHWAEMWGVDFDEVENRRDIMVAERVFLNHRLFKEAKLVLESLSKNHKLVIVSSRGPRVQADTIDWINQSFESIFSEFHFTKIWDRPMHILEQLKMTKAEVCREIGADYLIDDQPKHCIAAAEAGITALLFGSYRWTKVDDLPKNVIKVKNWLAVEKYFDGQS